MDRLGPRHRPAPTPPPARPARGPLFCTDRRPGPARRATTISWDVCPDTDRARLGYDRARVLIAQHTGLSLRTLRHSAATHLGEAGSRHTVNMAKGHWRSICPLHPPRPHRRHHRPRTPRPTAAPRLTRRHRRTVGGLFVGLAVGFDRLEQRGDEHLGEPLPVLLRAPAAGHGELFEDPRPGENIDLGGRPLRGQLRAQ